MLVHKIGGKVYVLPSVAVEYLGVPYSTIYRWCKDGSVRLLPGDPESIRKEHGSRYLIEMLSLYRKYRKVYLG